MARKNKDKVFQIRMSKAEEKAFRKLADFRHIPLAILIRQLLHRELDSHENFQAKQQVA